MRILAIYQGQDPTDREFREAFALHRDTIEGYCILEAVGAKQIGQRSFGTSMHESLLEQKAGECVRDRYFQTAIERDGDAWIVTCYEASNLRSNDRWIEQSANDAITRGRKWLNTMVQECSIVGRR